MRTELQAPVEGLGGAACARVTLPLRWQHMTNLQSSGFGLAGCRPGSIVDPFGGCGATGSGLRRAGRQVIRVDQRLAAPSRHRGGTPVERATRPPRHLQHHPGGAQHGQVLAPLRGAKVLDRPAVLAVVGWKFNAMAHRRAKTGRDLARDMDQIVREQSAAVRMTVLRCVCFRESALPSAARCL